MRIREWNGVDLTALSSAHTAVREPAGSDVYGEFYAALDRSDARVSPQWIEEKRALGRAIDELILARWRQRTGRLPVILSIGAGMGLAEADWLASGYPVVLQECQGKSLEWVRDVYPHGRILIGDARSVPLPSEIDIAIMMAVDYVMD